MSFFVEERLAKYKSELNDNFDIVCRFISVGNKKIGMIFLKSMIDKQIFVQGLMSPLMDYEGDTVTISDLKDDVLKMFEIEIVEEKDILTKIMSDNVLIFVDGEKNALAIDIEKTPVRSPSEPPTSSVIMGPREGFVEDVKTNIGLLRRRFKSGSLVIKEFEVGRHTKSKVCMFFLKGVADKNVVKAVSKKIESIDIDGVVDSHYMLSFLQENGSSIFKQVGTAEKPDIVAGKMLEGRVAIMVDGSPIALTVPFVVLEDLQSPNDYYTNPVYVSIIRIIRVIGVLFACVVPGVFISLKLYHYKAIPLKYLITISNSTQGLPFTPFIEIIFILILFQILYEVSLRLPRYLGLATSIVGALILGDTGVKAGLISPPTVIIIAMSIISMYTVPDQAPQLTILRWIFLLLGGGLGILGVIVGMIYLTDVMNSLNMYGVPYLAPISPRVNDDLKDALIKSRLTEMEYRPKSLNSKNKVRLKK